LGKPVGPPVRRGHLALAVLMVPVMATLVIAGGRAVKAREGVVTVDQIDPSAFTIDQQDADSEPATPRHQHCSQPGRYRVRGRSIPRSSPSRGSLAILAILSGSNRAHH
jgi:hypothetical protein